jgi:lysophospholipase L1-like esterase
MRLLLVLLVASLAAGAAPPSLEWDASDHGGNMVASGARLIRNSPFGSPWQTARSIISQSGGVRTVEIAIESMDDGQVMVGIANGKASIEAPLGVDSNSLGYWSNGNTWFKGAWGSVVPGSFSAGDVVGLQVDFRAKTVIFRKNSGAWSLPSSIEALGPDVYISASVYVASESTPSLRIISDDWIDIAEPSLNILVVGDSISLTGGVLKTYVARLGDEFQAQRSGWPNIRRFAINGASWDYAWPSSGYPFTLLQDFPRRVVPAMSTTLPNWLIMFAGTNGLAIAQHGAAAESASLQAYVITAIAAGFAPDHIIVPTMLPRAGVSDAERAAYNAAIVDHAERLGYRVARLDLDPHLGAPGATGDATLFLDGIHPTDAGHDIVKSIIYAIFPPQPRRHHWTERLPP